MSINNSIKKYYPVIVLVALTHAVIARPCSKIVFPLTNSKMIRVIARDFTVLWEYDENCASNRARSNKFIIRLTTMFDETILSDTIIGFETIIEANYLDQSGITLFTVQELGADEVYTISIKSKVDDAIQYSDDIEKINILLLNGYFHNALSILQALDNDTLIKAVKHQYEILFPRYYPNKDNFFNSYIERHPLQLRTMPYVTGLKEFISSLNKKAKNNSKNESITIRMSISRGNELMNYEVLPSRYNSEIKEVITQLKFDNNQPSNGLVYLKIEPNKNGKGFMVINRRALINPKSREFKKRFLPKGPVH